MVCQSKRARCVLCILALVTTCVNGAFTALGDGAGSGNEIEGGTISMSAGSVDCGSSINTGNWNDYCEITEAMPFLG